MTQSSSSEDGKFELFYQDGWACLLVHAPGRGGRPVYPEEVENRIKLLGAPSVSAKTIRDLVYEASGDPVRLVEWPAGRMLAATVDVDVAGDAMSATIIVQPPKKGAADPKIADIVTALAENGVVFGVDRGRIATLLADREYRVAVTVAMGQPPVYGRAHRIRYHFNVNRGKPYLEMEFGRINLRELNFIENRKKDDLLAELEEPVTAVDGYTVRGELIPAHTDTNTVQLRPGPNTRLSPDGTQLFAACDGNVRIASGKILVEPVIKVKNVNYETGNIHFDGSVVVEGSIADGFIVEAGGDLQVGSGVGKATLKAGGSVLLKTGISGNGEGTIDCDGDLFARFVESCTVTCRGNLIVEEAIMHSRVTSFGHCALNGKRSEVMAGDLIVGGSLWCKKLGNLIESPTRVSVGIEPNLLLTFRSTTSGLEQNQEELNRCEHQLEQLEALTDDGRGDDRVAAATEQLKARIMQIRMDMADLRSRLPGLREQMHAQADSMVVVEDTIYKGAVVIFGDHEYRPPDAGARKTILRSGEHGIVESGYNRSSRPKLVFESASAE